MTEESVYNTVKRYIASHLVIDPERIKKDSRLSDLGVDSLEMAAITMGLQDCYRFPEPKVSFGADHTVDHIVEYIQENRRDDGTLAVW